MVRRRHPMSQHIDFFKRAPIDESIAPSDASSKTEVNPPSSASPTTAPSSSTKPSNQEPSPSSLSFANDPSQSVIAFPEPSSTTTTSSIPTSSSSATVTTTSNASASSADPPTTTSSSISNTGTPTSVSDTQNDNSSAISGGAIGAIVAIVVIIILGFAAFFFIKRRQKRKADGTLNNNSNDRLTRFSMMGPTYNATGFTSNAPTMQQQQQSFNDMGQSTSGYYNTNTSMAYSSPHPAMTQPMQHQVVPPPMMMASQPPPPPMEQQQQQQQSTLQPLQLAPPTSASQPCMGAQPLTVAAGSAPEPMSATIITTPTTPEHPDSLWQQQPVPQQPQQSPPMMTTAAAVVPPPSMPSPQQQHQQVIGTYQVAAGYTPTLADEIEVRIGDHVQVLAEYDDGWCMGTNLTTGQQNGMFPMQCLGAAVSSTVPDPAHQQQPSQLVPNQPPQQINHRLSSLYTGPVVAEAPSMSHAY
ncbi:hypothetical protein K492DRAFT_204890 [Lichtheimia hyalospora FSU 10163]|nr:hypothetical protein K492DRAFT_204890 [Lichtheimia hyalospora FSU 10163]